MTIGSISEAAQRQLLAVAREVNEPKGAILFRRDDPAIGIFLLRSGKVSLQLEVEEGNTIWKRTATPCSIIGLPATLAGGLHSLTAVALQESQLGFIDSSSVIDLIRRDPAIGLELVRAVADEVVQIRTVLATTTEFTSA